MRGISLISLLVSMGLLGIVVLLLGSVFKLSFTTERDLDLSLTQGRIRAMVATKVFSEAAMVATRALPANASTLGQFTGSHAVNQGVLTLVEANGSNFLSAAGSGFGRKGERCAAPPCLFTLTASFTPRCPTGNPPCVTDFASITFELVKNDKGTTQTFRWSIFVHPGDFATDSPKRSICGGGRKGPKSVFDPSECTSPETSDDTCNRWGCATKDASDRSTCPSFATRVRLSDNYTYIGCNVYE